MINTETIKVNQVVNEKTVQSIVRGKIYLPDAKPDVQTVLSIEKSAKANRIQVLPNKVVVNGAINIQVVYVAFTPSQSVHSVSQQIPFTAFADLPGVLPGMKPFVEVTVEDISVTLDPADPRQFDVNIVLSVFVKVTQVQEVNVLVEAPPGVVVQKEKLKVEDVIGSGTKQIIVSDQFDIPLEKPDVESILSVDAEATVTDTRIVSDKIIVDGKITLQVMYVAMMPDQPVHDLHKELKFSDFLEVPGARPGMNVHVEVMVESAKVEALKDPDLEADIVLQLIAQVTETKQIDVITDIQEVAVEKVKLRVEGVVGEDTTQVVLRQTVDVPEEKSEVAKVLDTSVQELKVTDQEIIAGKVLLRGYVVVQVVYVSVQADQAVHALEAKLSFRTFIAIPGAEAGMTVDVRESVEYLKAEPVNDKLAIEAVLKLMAKVTEIIQLDIVVGIECVPEEEPICLPGQTIPYTVEQGDTMFTIAQHFGISLESLIAANPQISNPNKISVGQVINVPCLKAKG